MVKKKSKKSAHRPAGNKTVVTKMTLEKDNILVKMTSFFFRRWQLTLVLWVALLGFGAATYTTLIQREGFPPIQFPLSVVNGTYFVDDKDKIDQEIAQPLYEILKDVDKVSKVTTSSGDNFFTAVVNFESDADPVAATQSVEEAIAAATTLPEQAQIGVLAIDPAGFLNEFDMLLSVYSTDASTPVADIEEVANYVAAEFEKDEAITFVEVQNLLETGQNPLTGESETRQTAFNQIGLAVDGELSFNKSVTIGLDRDSEQLDIIELSEAAQSKLDALDLSQFGSEFEAVIGADYAESIDTQINSLESNLTTGLLAVALVSFLLITWRASIITGLFMVTVIAATIIMLYVVGYTLNTITLFALVLSLGLFVDDATIVVESIDAARKDKKKKLQTVKEAIRKIAAASFAGTFTTVLVFLPLAFLTGILGEFIRLMPVTVIIALISSLVLSLTVIPVLSRFLLLRHTGESWVTKVNPISKLEKWLGDKAGDVPRGLKTKTPKARIIAASMFALSVGFFMLGITYAGKTSFNIFPPTKDSDQIGFQVSYPAGYTIEQAEAVADQINNEIVTTIGPLATRVTYGSFGQPNNRSADALIELVPFNTRSVKSPELLEKLQSAIDETVPQDVSVRVLQFDSGPPVSEYPLQIQVTEENIAKASELAMEVQDYIQGATLTRTNGTEFTITETQLNIEQSVDRVDGNRTLTVQGAFDSDDTSALLVASETYVTDKFTSEYLTSNGYNADALGFDFGQETENADSFASLAYAFPIALLLMYILLAAQFRSFLQPILIFMAIPFTFLGVFAGLYYTDNAISFFVQVGLIGLIGIAVNNTILLTSYANQEKDAGVGTIDAISNAVTKRFRPLVTTTLTTVVALLPLALSDPFWEALAFTIIFGLVSSTILVVLSFPYYYLGAEWLRMRISKGTRMARKAKKA